MGSPVERVVRPLDAYPPLPTPAAWNCYWKGDNDSTSWDQWHDASDPMPEQWDSEPPDDVVPYFTSTQVLEYAGQCVREATAECSEHWRQQLDALRAALEWIEGATASTPGLTDAELGKAMAAIGAHARRALGPNA